MKNYQQLIKEIMLKGLDVPDRTGTGTRRLTSRFLSFDLEDGFPLVTHRKINYKAVVAELIWFLSGSTNVNDLHKLDCHIWDAWAKEDGSVGRLYGAQWRGNHLTVDQIATVIYQLKHDPFSRRIIIGSWDVNNLPVAGVFPTKQPEPRMSLAPCHPFVQFTVDPREDSVDKLNCTFVMRSSDSVIGLPYNIANYALLTHIIAAWVGLRVGTLTYHGIDVHVYNNHFSKIEQIIESDTYKLPNFAFWDLDKLLKPVDRNVPSVSKVSEELDLLFETNTTQTYNLLLDCLINYKHGPAIILPISV